MQGMEQGTQMSKEDASTYTVTFTRTASGNIGERPITVFNERTRERKRFVFYFMLFYTQ